MCTIQVHADSFKKERMALVYMLHIHRITSTQLALKEGPLMSYGFLYHRTSIWGLHDHHVLVAPTQNTTQIHPVHAMFHWILFPRLATFAAPVKDLALTTFSIRMHLKCAHALMQMLEGVCICAHAHIYNMHVSSGTTADHMFGTLSNSSPATKPHCYTSAGKLNYWGIAGLRQ